MAHPLWPFALALISILALVPLDPPLQAQTRPVAEAQWIAPYDSAGITPHTPCPVLRSAFTLGGEPKRGTIRVIGLGHFRLTLNGRQVGGSLIDEPWSQYNKTIYWQEFDISSLLKPGHNAFGVMLGNSFWRVGPANDTMRYIKTDAMPDFSRGFPYLLWLEARITGAGGRDTIITSDLTWKWTEGPLTFSNIYAGEDFDARRVQPGWDSPAFDDGSWHPVRSAPAPPAVTERYMGPVIRTFEVFRSRACSTEARYSAEPPAPAPVSTMKSGRNSWMICWIIHRSRGFCATGTP